MPGSQNNTAYANQVVYMSQSLARLLLHIIFATKNREPHFADLTIRRDVHAYLAATANHLGCPSVSVSVAESTLESVIEYVTKQDEHHRRLTFQEEYRAFLHRHHVNFDERYVWD